MGLDGGSWNVLEPLTRAGSLPNLARVMGGAWGPLESTIPPVTPPAWTSFMTGKNPGKHGVYHFVELEPGTYRLRYTNARSRKARTIWSILSEAGRRVAVVNVPMTFPPEPVDGFMVSGMDTPDANSDFVHPRSLVPDIRTAVGALKLDLHYLGFMHNDARRAQVLRELAEIDEQRLRLLLYLLERAPVEVLMVVWGSPDTSQHHFWHYADPAHHRYDAGGATRFGTAIADVHRRLDRHLGTLMNRLASDGVVMVVSDHGFGPTSSKIIYLNRYLAELGLLAYRQNGRASASRLLAPTLRRLDRTLRGLLSPERKMRLNALLPGLRARWEASVSAFNAIDWGATKAYCNESVSSSAQIWINMKGRQPEGTVAPGAEYRELVDFLSDRLCTLKDPVSGHPLIRRVIRKEQVYAGPYLGPAPDLMLAWWEGDGFAVKPSRPEDLGMPVVAEASAAGTGPAEWSGNHRLEGILAVHGAGIKPGTRVSGARIVDLAPTLLHLLDQPIPDDMDGRVLTEIFDAEYLRRRPVTSRSVADLKAPEDAATYSEEESEKIKRRLQDLGYLE
ncbi:MAG: alkaline phosphatase family protein [Candidatus Rokubacteria bacterium]|nr:alkaline phosphatase family protein [Candidatus Rokubacteria bacterium]